MAPTLTGVDHIHILVTNRSAALEWYAEVLGLHAMPELLFWAEGYGPLTVGNAAGTIHLALFERPREKCRSTVAFNVTALEFLAWKQHLCRVLARSVSAESHDISWSMYFSDPDGNPFEITSYEYAAIQAQLNRLR